MPQIQPESQIFCDMDGVLVDFQATAIEIVNNALSGHTTLSLKNTDRAQTVKNEKGAKWRAATNADLMLKPVRNLMFGIMGVSPGEVYATMSANQDGVQELWPFLNATGHQVNLLSAPIGRSGSPGMSSEEGKRIWAEQLTPSPAEIIITPA